MNILNTSKKFLKAGVCAIMLITAGQAQAQQVTVDASIDSLQLLIGEQAKVKLEISMDAKQKTATSVPTRYIGKRSGDIGYSQA